MARGNALPTDKLIVMDRFLQFSLEGGDPVTN